MSRRAANRPEPPPLARVGGLPITDGAEPEPHAHVPHQLSAEEGPEEGPEDPAEWALERALVRAKAGDEHGFTQLWRALHPPLLRYLAVRGNRPPDDIAAETWLHVVRDLPGFEGGMAQFRAWLFTVARHRAIDQARAGAARPVTPVPEPAEVMVRRQSPSAEESVMARTGTEAALALIATLPDEQAEMVMLRVVGGLPAAEVARVLGRSPGAVRVAVHRALRSLAADPRAVALMRGERDE